MGARQSPSTTQSPTVDSVLAVLSRERLFDLGRVAGVSLPASRQRNAELARSLLPFFEGRLPEIIRELGRDELRAVNESHGLTASSRTRAGLIEVLATAAGFNPAESVPPPDVRRDGLPRPGDVLNARHRQWLVESVEAGEAGDSSLLRLACLDDDAQGHRLDLLWDLELGAEVVAPDVAPFGGVQKLDPPAHFGAYLHAVQWSAVSAADATRFQAPFRAGIQIIPHQLTPLMKALELPRANLFIADDVGLGKTIEAGLVLQELILRQQAGFVLVVCPASVSLQWRDEMLRRFGLRFEVMTRELVARRRQERGFGWNPWATHHRFIVSHSILRRPEYFGPLMDHLRGRAEKGLLILDEAHVAAPASAARYAVDTDTTRTIRELAPKFDNRLFLSATPHNGHSSSFSALLEILDPVRFTRGQAIRRKEDLKPVMVRRLKRDLRQLGVESFPRRVLVQIALEHGRDGWSATEERYDAETGQVEPPRSIAAGLGGDAADIRMAEALRRYTELCDPRKGVGHFAFVGLQKRLLSSPAAFARSLATHAATLERQGGLRVATRPAPLELLEDPETHGTDDDVLAAEDDAEMERVTRALPTPAEEGAALLRELRALAEAAKGQPDAKVRALFAWMREHLCPAIGREHNEKAGTKWTDRRVILFTEYADTKRYLVDLLEQAIAHTDSPEGRIRTLHGGMGDDGREEVQRAFNAPPGRDPVRILVATDAAREGVNLQGFCADLFHVDVPWNPSRLEQRNGRIDRALQQAEEVRCHYFVYPQRAEDRVLQTLVRKVATIQRELGSAGAVLLDDIDALLEDGIDGRAAERLHRVGEGKTSAAAEHDLEAQRKDLKELEAEVHRAAQRLERSAKTAGVSASALRGVVDVGLRLAGTVGLVQAPPIEGRELFLLPELDRSWAETLDTLRPRRGRMEGFWEWRRRPPRPVTFAPIERLTDEIEQLHLAHPVVRRILDRFLAQGFSAHDLSRVCGVVAPGESVARVVAYARLTLFGQGAARLHDEIIAVAAPWPAGAPDGVAPYKDAVTAANARAAVEAALAGGGRSLPAAVERRALAAAPALFGALWPHLDEEANARAVDARTGLARRARKESDELRELLVRKRESLADDLARLRQTDLFTADATTAADRKQKRQVELDIEHLERRASGIDDEIEAEPKAIEALYDVRMTRKTPLGLVVAWPQGMT